MGRVESGQRFSNLVGRVGSGQPFFNLAGRVGSSEEVFELSRVRWGRVETFCYFSRLAPGPTRPDPWRMA